MKRPVNHVYAIALLLALIAAGLMLGSGAKAGKPPSDVPVTTTIEGLGVDTSPALRVQSDQAGSYKNSSSLQSVLQATFGDWVLDMINFPSSPQRKALVDLRDPVPGSLNGGAPAPPFAYQLVRARFIAKCNEYGGDMRTIPGGATIYCPLAIAFDDAGGVRYRLNMNPNNFIGTNPVQITCVATDANAKCNQWKIEPSATQLNGERKNVAKLLKVATKPRQADQDMGDFYLSFTMNLTNP